MGLEVIRSNPGGVGAAAFVPVVFNADAGGPATFLNQPAAETEFNAVTVSRRFVDLRVLTALVG